MLCCVRQSTMLAAGAMEGDAVHDLRCKYEAHTDGNSSTYSPPEGYRSRHCWLEWMCLELGGRCSGHLRA